MKPEYYFSFLRERGVRITPVMAATVTFLQKSRKFHTPQELQKELSTMLCCNVGFPTLYRILERLLSFDLIVPMFSKQLQTAYYLCQSPDISHHHHFICKKCNKVHEIVHCTEDSFHNYVNDTLGASVTGHIMQLEGICATCL